MRFELKEVAQHFELDSLIIHFLQWKNVKLWEGSGNNLPGHFVGEAPRSGPLFDALTRAKSAKELKEHLETRVL
jgi:hypothetical protein